MSYIKHLFHTCLHVLFDFHKFNIATEHEAFVFQDSPLPSCRWKSVYHEKRLPSIPLSQSPLVRLQVLFCRNLFITSPKVASSLRSIRSDQSLRADYGSHLSKPGGNLPPRALCFLLWHAAKAASLSIELVSYLSRMFIAYLTKLDSD